MPDREASVRCAVKLIELAERRVKLVADLSVLVALAVDQADPDHLRDTSPTWWAGVHPWQKLDALDRFRLAHDRLVVLEIQAGVVVQDLRGMFALRAVGSPERPLGVPPAKALAEMMTLAARRWAILDELEHAERSLRPKVEAQTSGAVRRAVKVMRREEETARADRARLAELLARDDHEGLARSG